MSWRAGAEQRPWTSQLGPSGANETVGRRGFDVPVHSGTANTEGNNSLLGENAVAESGKLLARGEPKTGMSNPPSL
ncbi:hypothetical protein GCM10009693_24880 [Leucobacter chromiireducens subsp. chromiireducens]